MAEKKKRIHHLAKELLVKSKTIIEKCAAEGIEIKNHMHVVSAGLEATIREWFSSGSHTTTLEESERVNLEVVRVKPKRTTRKKNKAAAQDESADAAGGDTATAVLEAEPPAAVLPPPPEVEQTTPQPLPVEAPGQSHEAPPIIEEPPPTEVAAEGDLAAAAEVSPPQAEPQSDLEQEVFVAGPQNVPQPAKLTGPKVIRIDKPDPVRRPRPAPRPPVSRPAPDFTGPQLPSEIGKEERHGRGTKRPAAAGDAAPHRSHPRRGPRDNRQATSEKLNEWREREVLEMRERLAQASGRGIGGLRAVEKKRGAGQRGGIALSAKKSKIELTEPINVKDFSKEAGIPVIAIVKKIAEEQGAPVGINARLDADMAQLIAVEYGIELTINKEKSKLDELAEEFAAIERKNPRPRPPIVTVLGHVDHGKTSLLDQIRKANVTAGEAGGITQHIGAYRVQAGDKFVTFLDTPGHAAFTAMRARGANMTDVVVLVVAADDGIMPTTIEAINHAKAAGSTIVVALNKIDLDHDLNKIYGQLAERDLTPSGDWGGDTDVIKTSAITGQGIEDLLAHLATLSDVMELQADPTIPATGTVIEAERSDRIGCIARILVQEGTLKTGDVIVCGAAHGRVRSIKDENGRTLKKAGPSTPVEVTGLNDVPQAGDRFYVLRNARRAKEIAEEIEARRHQESLARVAKPTNLESVFASVAEGEIPELNVIIRADVQGSIDALRQELTSFPDDEVKLNIMHAGVGSVTQSDIELAKAGGAIIIAFYIVPDPSIQKQADAAGVDIRSYRIIYEVIDDIRRALEGLLPPEEKIESRGRAEVREIFGVSKIGKVAGCFIREGSINRNCRVRVVRDGVPVVESATIESLRRFKDDVKEVKSGFECGIKITGFNDVKPDDIIEAFEIVQIARTLGSST